MTSTQKAEASAAHIQAILEQFWKSNSQNVRLKAEVDILRSKVRSIESLLNEKERRLILLTELLDRRGQPRLPEPEPEAIEAEVSS